MKIRISELSALEKAGLKVNVVNAHGLDFYNKCVAEDAPVIGTIDVTSTKEGPEFWINVLTEGEPTSENLIELTQRTLQVMESLISGSSRSTEYTDDLVVGKWYGVTDGTSNDVISIFKYNGLGGGRTGWDTEGNWSTSTATILALPSSTVIDVVYFGSTSYELTLTSGFVYNAGQDWYEATYTSLTPTPENPLDGLVTTISFTA